MENREIRQEMVPALLDGYARQGRVFLMSAAQNLIQYGRVLTEAKPLLKHGQFGKWVQESFGMSERSAQGYMAVWRRFGENEMLSGVQFSNLQKMLALPEGTETEFAKENDLSAMTAREVEAAVRRVREEQTEEMNRAVGQVKKELAREQEARKDAERRAEAAQERAPDRKLLLELDEKKRQIEDLTRRAEIADRAAEKSAEAERTALRAAADAKRDLKEAEEMLEESQQEFARVQTELLNARSAAARGDADRIVSDQLTLEDFGQAVRIFLGATAPMPYMAGSFANMTDDREIRQWQEMLEAVADWAERSRKALKGAGGIIDG